MALFGLDFRLSLILMNNGAVLDALESKMEGEKGKEATTPRPEAKLADFGLAVSFVSPDIATRRSALPRYVSSLASVLAGKEKEASATTATAAAAAAIAAALPR